MSDHHRYDSLRSVEIVSEFDAINIALDYDVMRLGPRTWGIRGHIAYDGEVLAATFQSESQAWVALSPLRPTARGADSDRANPATRIGVL
jgi:hypothetical protein